MGAPEIISASLITAELIEFQQWPACGSAHVAKHPALDKVNDMRDKDYVGAIITGAGLVADFVDTYYGVIESSRWPDPQRVFSFFLTYAEARSAGIGPPLWRASCLERSMGEVLLAAGSVCCSRVSAVEAQGGF